MHDGSIALSSSTMVLNPRVELDGFAHREGFAWGVVRAATLIEYFGVRSIKRAREECKIPISEERISNLTLAGVISLLFKHDLVNERTHALLEEIREVRNELVHEIGKMYSLDKQEAIGIIENAKECINVLQSS